MALLSPKIQDWPGQHSDIMSQKKLSNNNNGNNKITPDPNECFADSLCFAGECYLRKK
jgi:hypothetical protein